MTPHQPQHEPQDPGDPLGAKPTSSWAALRIASIYLVVALLWIFLSDRVVSLFSQSASDSQLYQTLKGSFYVISTALLLWALIARHFNRLQSLNQRLAQSEARHRKLLGQAPVAIVLVENGRIEYRNDRALPLLGKPGLQSDTFLAHILPESRDAVAAVIERVLREDVPATIDDTPFRDAQGRDRLVELTISCKSAPSRSVVIAVTDITERKRLESIVRDAQRIETAGSIAGQVTHEFNNVLTAILGQTAIARSAVHNDPQAIEALARIESVGQHAAGLTRSLLLFQRQSPSIKKPVPVSAIMDGAATLIAGILPHSVKLELDLADIENVSCFSDAAQLKQAFLNLAVNARDAMPHGGALRITGRLAPGPTPGTPPMMVITVADTGPGIPPRVMERLFTPFFTTKAAGKGTGLGLAVTRGIIHDHEGTITASSPPGGGAVFTLTLPTVAAEAPAKSPPHSSAAPSPLQTHPTALPAPKRAPIVIVGEDNPSVRNVVVESLRMAGYHIIPCNDGGSVINAAAAHITDLAALVLDVGLPGYTGIECLARIRAENPYVPCVLTTGGARPDVPYELVDRTAFLAKPFSIDDLLDTVGALVAMERPEASNGRR